MEYSWGVYYSVPFSFAFYLFFVWYFRMVEQVILKQNSKYLRPLYSTSYIYITYILH